MSDVSRASEKVASDGLLMSVGRTLPVLRVSNDALAGSASPLAAMAGGHPRHPELPSIEEFARIGEAGGGDRAAGLSLETALEGMDNAMAEADGAMADGDGSRVFGNDAGMEERENGADPIERDTPELDAPELDAPGLDAPGLDAMHVLETMGGLEAAGPIHPEDLRPLDGGVSGEDATNEERGPIAGTHEAHADMPPGGCGVVVLAGPADSSALRFDASGHFPVDLSDVHLAPAGRFHLPVARKRYGAWYLADIGTRRSIPPARLDLPKEAEILLRVAGDRDPLFSECLVVEGPVAPLCLRGIGLAPRLREIRDAQASGRHVGIAEPAPPLHGAGAAMPRWVDAPLSSRWIDIPAAWAAGWLEAEATGEPVIVVDHALEGTAIVLVRPDGSLDPSTAWVGTSLLDGLIADIDRIIVSDAETVMGRPMGEWRPGFDRIDMALGYGVSRWQGQNRDLSSRIFPSVEKHIAEVFDAVRGIVSVHAEASAILVFDNAGLPHLTRRTILACPDRMPVIDEKKPSAEAIAWIWRRIAPASKA